MVSPQRCLKISVPVLMYRFALFDPLAAKLPKGSHYTMAPRTHRIHAHVLEEKEKRRQG
jgi:hypothetical protein